jgi:hypothetical protein
MTCLERVGSTPDRPNVLNWPVLQGEDAVAAPNQLASVLAARIQALETTSGSAKEREVVKVHKKALRDALKELQATNVSPEAKLAQLQSRFMAMVGVRSCRFHSTIQALVHQVRALMIVPHTVDRHKST